MLFASALFLPLLPPADKVLKLSERDVARYRNVVRERDDLGVLDGLRKFSLAQGAVKRPKKGIVCIFNRLCGDAWNEDTNAENPGSRAAPTVQKRCLQW